MGKPLQNRPEYYKRLKDKFEQFIKGKELLPVSSVMKRKNTGKIYLLPTDAETWKWIAVNMEEALKAMNEALKSLQIAVKILGRRSNSMWNILLAMEYAVKSLAWCMLTTKSVRLQTDYLRTRKLKARLHKESLFISEDHLGFFFWHFGGGFWDLAH